MIHQAIITNNKDPDFMCRVKVKCQTIVASERDLPMWISPDPVFLDSTGATFFAVPSIDTIVDLVELPQQPIADGDFHESYIENPQYRYRPTRYSKTQSLPQIWRENYTKRYGLSSPAGHAWYFDDEAEVIVMLHKSGNSSITFRKDGTLVFKGAEIHVGEGASEPITLGQELLTLLTQWRAQEIGHTHTAPGGATGTPIYPGAGPTAPTSALNSSKHKVGS